jgi:hypothetical protein
MFIILSLVFAFSDYDGNGAWLRKPLQMSRGRPGVWLHWTCALYSPLTFLGSRQHISEEDLSLILAAEKESAAQAQQLNFNTSSPSSAIAGGAGVTSEEGGGDAKKGVIVEEDANATYWFNVRKEVTRGRQLACTACGQKGATIGCMVNIYR